MASPAFLHHPSESPDTTSVTTAPADTSRRPVVLVTGATGRIGGKLVDRPKQDSSIALRALIRRPEQAAFFACDAPAALVLCSN